MTWCDFDLKGFLFLRRISWESPSFIFSITEMPNFSFNQSSQNIFQKPLVKLSLRSQGNFWRENSDMPWLWQKRLLSLMGISWESPSFACSIEQIRYYRRDSKLFLLALAAFCFIIASTSLSLLFIEKRALKRTKLFLIDVVISSFEHRFHLFDWSIESI